MTESDYPDGGKTTVSYIDTAPNPSVTTCKVLSQGVSACSTTTMDGLGHAVKVVGENNAETDMTYDGEGALYTQTNPGDPSHLTTYNHDALGRLSSTGYQDGSTASVVYTGNCATTTDPASKTNTTCSDAFGRITSDTDGLGNTTTYTYDALDNLISVTQGGQSRSFHYNSLSEMYQAINPESGTTNYTYDADGNVTSRADARGIVTCYGTWTGSTCDSSNGYDVDNRLLSKTYSDGTPTVSFTYGQSSQSSVTIGSWSSPALYNTSGRMIEAKTTANGSTQTDLVYNYDTMGRVKDLWQCAPYNCGNSSIWHMAYNYNLAGDVLNYTNPAGFTVTRTINSAQQVTSQTYGTNMAVSSITYEPWGAISTMCGGQGCSKSQETRQYNKRLQPLLMELGNQSNLSADYSLAYSYAPSASPPCSLPQGSGDNGNITGATYTDNVNTGYSHTYTYCYDGVNRLTHAVASGSPVYDMTYAYDQYGNGWCVGGSGGGVCPAVNYNSNKNQLTSIGGATPITVNYDAAGNQLDDQYRNYQYDAEGRVISSVDISGPAWQYPLYNALGQRVEDYQSDSLGGGMQLTYPRDIFGQRTGIFDQRPSINWTGWDVYWSQVAGQRLNMGGSSAYIDHADAIGSTLMETDPAGAVQWDVTRYPWGRVWQQTGTRGSAVFAGLDWAVNDILIPSATREYNFRIYRWMTPDPGGAGAEVGNSQSWNMYSYAGDNPSSRNDPSGEDYHLLGGDSCGTDKVECDKQGYVLDSNGQREIITDQQVLSGAVGSTVGQNGVSSITTSQGTFQAQFFDTSPSTYEVTGQPGSTAAAIGLNAFFGLSNAASDLFAPVVGFRPSYMQDIPTGTGVAANVGVGAALLGTLLIGPGGEGVSLTEHALDRALERGITRQEVNEALRTARASGDVVSQMGKYGTVQQVFTGKNNVVVVVETTGRNAGKAISVWRK